MYDGCMVDFLFYVTLLDDNVISILHSFCHFLVQGLHLTYVGLYHNSFSLQGLQQPLNVPLGNVNSFHHSDEPLGKLVLVDYSRFRNGGSSLCFRLLPGLGAIVVDGIAYLDIFGQTSSGGLSVSVVGHCGVIGGFGNWLLFFALEEGLFIFSIFRLVNLVAFALSL
jgi:hypothetical protein